MAVLTQHSKLCTRNAISCVTRGIIQDRVGVLVHDGQPKVSNLDRKVLCNQQIMALQVSVDDVPRPGKGASGENQKHNCILCPSINSLLVEVAHALCSLKSKVDACDCRDGSYRIVQEVIESSALTPLGDDEYIGWPSACANVQHDIRMAQLGENGHFCFEADQHL